MTQPSLISIKCEWGVVKVVYMAGNKVYVIHDPLFYESSTRIAEELKKQGYDVTRLNTGVTYEREMANKLLDFCSDNLM